jgi:hypothetical protein
VPLVLPEGPSEGCSGRSSYAEYLRNTELRAELWRGG